MAKKFDPVETQKATMKAVLAVKREIAKKVVSTVVLSTPRGMPETWRSPPPAGYQPGHARFSWRTTLNAPQTGDAPGFDPGGTATIFEGFSVIDKSVLNDKIFISNNAPYIQRLDEGWSRQAPANFVAKAIVAGITSLADTVIEVP